MEAAQNYCIALLAQHVVIWSGPQYNYFFGNIRVLFGCERISPQANWVTISMKTSFKRFSGWGGTGLLLDEFHKDHP